MCNKHTVTRDNPGGASFLTDFNYTLILTPTEVSAMKHRPVRDSLLT